MAMTSCHCLTAILLQRRVARDPSVVDQYLDCTEFLLYAPHASRARFEFCNVELEDGDAGFRCEFSCRFIIADVVGGDFVSGVSEGQGNGMPNAAGSTCYQCDALHAASMAG